MMSYKTWLKFCLGLLAIGTSLDGGAVNCAWDRVPKKSSFEADVEVRITPDVNHVKGSEHNPGKLIVAGPGIFSWMVREGLQRHLYHGDGIFLRYYYKSATASRYVRKGEIQSLDTVWVGYLDELFWQKSRSSPVRFSMKHQALSGGCQTTWMPAAETSALPPFTGITLTWTPLTPPVVHDLELTEVGGRRVGLHFERFRWGAPFSPDQLQKPQFVLTHVVN